MHDILITCCKSSIWKLCVTKLSFILNGLSMIYIHTSDATYHKKQSSFYSNKKNISKSGVTAAAGYVTQIHYGHATWLRHMLLTSITFYKLHSAAFAFSGTVLLNTDLKFRNTWVRLKFLTARLALNDTHVMAW